MRLLVWVVCLMAYCRLSTAAKCDEVDAIIILDGSASIPDKEFDQMKKNLEKFSKMSFGGIDLNLAWMTFGGTAHLKWRFSVDQYPDYWGADQLKKNNDISQVHLALIEANKVFEEGAGVRPSASKAVILITDGNATESTPTVEAANVLKDKGVLLLTVGFGKEVVPSALQEWASEERYSFIAQPPNEMRGINKLIKKSFKEEFCGCKKVDAMIILDGSASIPTEEHTEMKEHLRDFAKMNFGGIDLNIAWMTFGGTASVQWKFSAGGHYPDYGGVDNLRPNHDISQVHLALIKAKEEFEQGAGVRPRAKKVVILITDGNATEPTPTVDAANALKDSGVLLVTVGIGKDVPNAFQELASEKDYSFVAKSAGKMGGINKKIKKIFKKEFCDRPSPLPPICKLEIPSKDMMFDMNSRYSSDGSAYIFGFQCAVAGQRDVREMSIFKRNDGGSEEEIARLTPEGFVSSVKHVKPVVTAIDCSQSDDEECTEEAYSSFLRIELKHYAREFIHDSTPELQKFGCRAKDSKGAEGEATEVYRVREPEDSPVDDSRKSCKMHFKSRTGFDFDGTLEYISMRCSVTWPTDEIEVQMPDGTVLGRLFGDSKTEKWNGEFRRLKVFGALDCAGDSKHANKCNDGEKGFLRVDYHPAKQEDVKTDDFPFYNPKCVITSSAFGKEEQDRFYRIAQVSEYH